MMREVKGVYINEIAASLYPWDIADEGVETCVDNLVKLCGVNSVYLVGLMHKEKRPLDQLYFPHNPKRKYYIPEDSRAYYRLDEANFANTPLKPLYSEAPFLRDKDWLEELIGCARGKGLKVGVEISHTIFDADIAERDFPEILQKDIYGNPVGGEKIIDRRILCPNHPYVREYIKALFYDTVKNRDIDFIQSCLVMFYEGRPLRNEHDRELANVLGTLHGGCFCASCGAEARALGYDWDAMLAELRRLSDIVKEKELQDMMELRLLEQGNLLATGLMLQYPTLFQWLEFRTKSITRLFRDISEQIKRANPKVEFRYNTYIRYPELGGMNFAAIRDYVDSVRESDYAEQSGDVRRLELKRQKILKIRGAIGHDKPLIAAVGVRKQATEEIIRESLKMLGELGVDGISLGHYDGATFSRLRAVKEGMDSGELILNRLRE